MELSEIYSQVQNPIDNPRIIEKLIVAYANSAKGLGGFYGHLTKTAQKKHNRGQYYLKDADRFYAMMFNKWKNNIVAITRNEFIELYKRGSYGADFLKMREYLKKIPDVSTMQEANNIFYKKTGDKELDEAIEKYRWTEFGEGSTWEHVCSRYVTAKKDKYPNIEHRLYLDTESLDTYKMITYFVEKCDQHHLPYYFKFDQFGDRDDTIVIYSSTETLAAYIDILKEIKREHPDLVSRMKEPPALTGRIDGWIGYGSEPSKAPDGKNRSFNEVRAKAIEPILDKATKKWVMDHRNTIGVYQGQRVTFQEYIVRVSFDHLLADLERSFQINEEIERRAAQRKGTIYNQAIVINKLGYTLPEIRSQKFKENVCILLRAKMGMALPNVCSGNYRNIQMIDINVRNGKKITFGGYDLDKVIKEIAPNIAENDRSFIPSIQTQLKNEARQYGIDSNNYCFDMQKVMAMKKMPKKTEIPVNKKQIDTKKDLKTLDIQTIIQMINPALLARKMKLPNGAIISAEQYIQEIVFPHLPSSGLVTLANGGILTVKQFIEEGVMFECQSKYNGDFVRYMAEKTRNNVGVISLEYGNEKFEISPVEITKYINPALLARKMKLPNGAVISAEQYIEEVFAPYIPANGRIILKNGADISVKQYIEDILMWEGQEKYNGDINLILFNTTRNNKGIVNNDARIMQEELRKLNKAVNQGVAVGSGPKH